MRLRKLKLKMKFITLIVGAVVAATQVKAVNIQNDKEMFDFTWDNVEQRPEDYMEIKDIDGDGILDYYSDWKSSKWVKRHGW